ncbi:hypothetical protein ACF07W_38570 [Streptomyces sp. NPDC015140]
MDIEEEEVAETYHYGVDNEMEGVDIFTHFKENKDFEALKTIFFKEEFRYLHYCPFCNHKVPIVFKSSKALPPEMIGPYLHSDINISSNEQHNGNMRAAKQLFLERYELIRTLLFDQDNISKIELSCTANKEHKFHVIFKLDKTGYLTKIGQSPSVSDFDNTAPKRYKSIIKDKTTIEELKKSILLNSNGMGIGSYVYLRRIFERLILDQFEIYLNENPTADKKNFLELHMDKKIEFLKDYLPPFLFKNRKTIYKILSKGIHELSEEECVKYYNTVNAAIIIILEDKLAIDEKRKRDIEINKSLQKTYFEINN